MGSAWVGSIVNVRVHAPPSRVFASPPGVINFFTGQVFPSSVDSAANSPKTRRGLSVESGMRSPLGLPVEPDV